METIQGGVSAKRYEMRFIAFWLRVWNEISAVNAMWCYCGQGRNRIQ
jgi:hypothetical protein